MTTSYVNASTPITTFVANVGINSNGNVFITFKNTIEEPGCTGVQLVLENNNAFSKEVLSIAMTAHASNSKVVVKAKGCFSATQPGFNAANQDWGWFYLAPK